MKKAALFLLILLFLGSVALGVGYSMNHYVIQDWTLYPRDSAQLDFRGQALTPEQFDSLQQKLPECLILWDVPIQGQLVPSNAQELTVSSLTADDRAMLGYLPDLVQVNAQECRDYPELMALIEERPECQVNYTVTVDGNSYPGNATSIQFQNLTDADISALQWLKNLNYINANSCESYGRLRQLALEHPQWKLYYSVNLGGTYYSSNTKRLTLEGVSEEELLNGIPALVRLEKLELINCPVSVETLAALEQAIPGLEISWQIVLGGQSFDRDCTEIYLENAELGSLEHVRSAGESLPNLEKMTLVDCTVEGQEIDNEALAQLREEVRESFKLVWRVYCGRVVAMTDDTWFMPIQQGEYYFQHEHAYNLRYCEDMVCIDIGHHPVRDVAFAAFMPHLKYLIITDTQVQDISGISNCKELIYFENTFTICRDFSPLLNCTALEDVNLEKPWYFADLSPILQMTWLKNFFFSEWSDLNIAAVQEALPNTHISWVSHPASSGIGWRNLQNYYDMRDILGMGYMN